MTAVEVNLLDGCRGATSMRRPRSKKTKNAAKPVAGIKITTSGASPLPVGQVQPQPAITAAQLLRALETLYQDRLRPLDSHVLRRLDELTCKRGTPARSVPEDGLSPIHTRGSRSAVRLYELRSLARTIPSIELLPLPGDAQRYWLCLIGITEDFVDESSADDHYPEELWQELHCYVSEQNALGAGERRFSMAIAKSRYDCARELRDKVPYLAAHGYKLGDVCHIVQLAVTSRCILGYREGWLLPYAASVDYEKQCEARQCRGKASQLEVAETAGRAPFSGDSCGSSSGASVRSSGSDELWQQLRVCLLRILDFERWSHGLPLSAAKATLLERCGYELRETALGYTKLSRVFKDERLLGTFEVITEGYEQYVRRRARSCSSGIESGCETPVSEFQKVIKNTFIELSPISRTHSMRRISSSPACLQSGWTEICGEGRKVRDGREGQAGLSEACDLSGFFRRVRLDGVFQQR